MSAALETAGGHFGTGQRYLNRSNFNGYVGEPNANQIGVLLDTLGPGNFPAPLGTNKAVTLQTLADRFNGPNPVVAENLKSVVDRFDGSWQAAIAPIARSEMIQRVNTISYPSVVLEPTPEGSTPRAINRQYQSVAYELVRYGLSAHFMHDFFMTPEGERDFQESTKTLISATWKRAKLSVVSALENAQSVWYSRVGNDGVTYETPLAATATEREAAFCIPYNPGKALDILNTKVSEIGRTEGQEFDSVVFPSNTLSAVAQSAFRTEQFRSGANAMNSLQIGGPSVTLPGKTLYEHKQTPVANEPREAVDQLVSVSQFGHYFVLSADNSVCNMKECDAQKAKSIMVVDGTTPDNWAEISELRAKAASQRYNVHGDGRLTDTHHELVENIRSLMMDTGIQITDGFFDPYIYTTEAPFNDLDSNPANNGLKVIEYYGDAPLQAMTIEQFADYGKSVVNHLLSRRTVSDADVQAIETLRRIGEQLNDYDPSAAEVGAFFTAVATANGGAAAVENGLLRANQYGGVDPPTTTQGGSTVPFGFGGITGLRTLAGMYRSGQYRGYDVNMLRAISDGIQALDIVVSNLLVLNPRNIFSNNPDNIPIHLRSGNTRMDIANAIVAAFLQNQPHPVMVSVRGAAAAVVAVVDNVDDIVGEGAGATLQDVDFSVMAPNVVAVFQNANKLAEVVNKFPDYMGQKFEQYFKARQTPNASSSFAFFLGQALNQVPEDPEQAAIARRQNGNVLSAVVNLVLSGDRSIRLITDNYLETLAKGSSEVRTKKRGRGNPSGADSTFVNSRLTIADGKWEYLARRNAAPVDPIRPSDPRNTLFALEWANANDRNERMTFARADGGIFGSEGMYGNRQGRSVSSRDRALREDFEVTGAARGSVFSAEFADAFVDTVGYEDRYGHAQADSMFVQTTKKNLVARTNGLIKMELDAVTKLGALLYCLTEAHWDNVVANSKAGLPGFGSSLIIAQPWMRFRGAAGVWFKAGIARTGVEYDDTSLQLNVENKKWMLHLTVWIGCTIFDTTGYMIVPNLDFRGLQSGFDSSFIEDSDNFDINNIDFETTNSMFVFDIGNVSPRTLPDPITLSGRYHRDSFPAQRFSDMDRYFGTTGHPTYNSALFYCARWGFHRIGAHGPDHDSFVAMRESDYVNEVMYTGRQRNYNPQTGDYTILTPGTGHIDKFSPPYGTLFMGGARLNNAPAMGITAV